MEVGRFLQEFFLHLNDRKVRYCVLWGYEDLPNSPGNDVDLWVHPEDQPKFRETLLEIAQQNSWSVLFPIVSARLVGQGEGKYYLIHRTPPYDIVHIDSWSILYWKGIPYIEEMTKAFYMTPKGFNIPVPGVEAACLLLRSCLNGRELTDYHKQKIAEGLRKDSQRFFQILSEALGDKPSSFVVRLVSKHEWDNIPSPWYFRKHLIIQSLRRKPFRQMRWWLTYLIQGVRIRLRGGYRLFVAFIGPDGSGKTTLAARLIQSKMVQKCFSSIWYFHTNFPCLPRLRRFVPKWWLRAPDGTAFSKTQVRDLRPLSFFRCLIYPLYYGLANFLAHFWLWTQKKKGTLIVLDRYYYEYWVQPVFARCPAWLPKLIMRFIPQPDLVFYIKNSPQILHNRKEELPLEEIERQCQVYEAIVKSLSSGHILDGSLNILRLAQEIEAMVIRVLERRLSV